MALLLDDRGLLPVDMVGPSRKCRVFDFQFDAAYAAGGYVLAAAALGFATVEQFLVGPISGYVPEYDFVNGKLKVLYAANSAGASSALIEVPNNHATINNMVARGLVVGTV